MNSSSKHEDVKRYCEECEKNVDTKEVIKKEKYNVLGETIEVDAKVLVCQECGEEFFSEELDSKTLLDAFNEYRRRHRLLFADEIMRIREQYGMSQRSFAKLLNWGDKTIRRYENGSIQDKVHNSLLLFLKEPENMREYIEKNEITLSEKQKNSLISNIEKLEKDANLRNKSELLGSFFSSEPSDENGFQIFDYDKVCEMVIYFVKNNDELLKTKLLKLLYYSDMIFYKENGVSISGSSYIHLPYGPVLKNHEILFGKMADDNLAQIDIIFNGIYEKHRVVSDVILSNGVLSDDEINILERINEKFKNFESKEISEYSHKEIGYLSTVQGETISYTYAKDIILY